MKVRKYGGINLVSIRKIRMRPERVEAIYMGTSPPVGAQPDRDACAGKVPGELHVQAGRRLFRTVMNKEQSRS